MILPGFPRPLAAKTGFSPSTPLGTYVLEQGGFFMGIITYADSRIFALFTADKSVGEDMLRWRTSNINTSGTTSNDDGFANLAAMETVGLSQHPMGNACKGYTINGFTDWYPPALNELALIVANKGFFPSGQELEAASYYWTSRQVSGDTGRAWGIRPSDGLQNDFPKTSTTTRFRAIRRLQM